MAKTYGCDTDGLSCLLCLLTTSILQVKSFKSVEEICGHSSVGSLAEGNPPGSAIDVALAHCGPLPDTPAPVEQTGQTTPFSPGDDGSIRAGVPWPSPRFTDHGNGTVTDDLTGLMWLKNADCFLCSRGLPWANAVGEANSLAEGSCGLTDGSAPGDWRLPNVKELLSLIDYGRVAPALAAGHPFVNVRPSAYWSSTTRPDNQNLAWYVELFSGQSAVVDKISQASPLCVWPVRGGH